MPRVWVPNAARRWLRFLSFVRLFEVQVNANTERTTWEKSVWGDLGPPGSRTKESIWAKVLGLGLPRERAIAVAKNIWDGELAFRVGKAYNPFKALPYPVGPGQKPDPEPEKPWIRREPAQQKLL